MRPKGRLWQVWTSRSKLDVLAVHQKSVELTKLPSTCATGALLGFTMGNLKKLAENILSSEQGHYGEVRLVFCWPAFPLRCSSQQQYHWNCTNKFAHRLLWCLKDNRLTVGPPPLSFLALR
jgi:hypothetical protein